MRDGNHGRMYVFRGRGVGEQGTEEASRTEKEEGTYSPARDTRKKLKILHTVWFWRRFYPSRKATPRPNT